ncbi:MAG: LicD family protein [Butyrivibrio sp.]|nr:LicD family protein [Butyrivibrio sp.]
MGKKIDHRHFYKTGFVGAPGTFELSGEELHRVQDALCRMLADVMAACDELHISCTLGGGSVLGCIRHGGFIPWDDDIDLNMTRRDFCLFASQFDRTLGRRYILCGPAGGRRHGMAHYQIKRRGSVYRSFNELNKPDVGLYLDLFLIENTPDNALLRSLHGILCMGFGYLLTCRKTAEDWQALAPYLTANRHLHRAYALKRCIGRLFTWIPLDRLCRLTDRVYRLCRNEHSQYVTIPTGRRHYFGELSLREGLCDTKHAVFAGIPVRLPADTDSYMRRLYGPDYMTPPPPSAREAHVLVALSLPEET